MTQLRILALGAIVCAPLPAISVARAQNAIVQPINPDAQALATQIRVLAENPKDIDALLAAGQLSTRLGDLTAALAFFQRAEDVEPGNPRILNGRASVLVRQERPGEALRLFQQAEARGIDPREYAADRAWAYDLLGQPVLAQRDYRLALAQRREDEVVRHYALSLGISGDVAESQKLLDPLLRAQDAAAWRARAFILAMNGDVAGAEKIAATVMPNNMGREMLPFFRRLQAMAPADRAFAVHFGELLPTPARIADARLAPSMPPYSPGQRPVQLAQATPPAQPVTSGTGSRRERGQRNVAPPAARPVTAPVATSVPSERNPIVTPAASPPAAEAPRVAAAPPPVAPTPTPTPTPLEAAAAPPSSTTRAAEPPVALAPRAAVPKRPVRRVGAEDERLASIIAGITIPASELDAVNRPGGAVAEAASGPQPVVARSEPRPASAEAAVVRERSEARKPEPKKPEPKKPEPKKKPDPKKPDPAKTDPKRIWVQVAGGANADTLDRAWKATTAKSPALFKGRAGWWTPLRATNRVLTGPFKTEDEAQAFVNKLARAGLSGFVFTSEAGQKVTKLAP